ncbi:hypothetical protein [Robertmurraya andreesenii]|uniref:Uncharacterized protein n=1 Tax=Anoxybacillus andreesenii TaxID=1325932 RepID=A0ABT9V1T0_9BACL|nr:hypothetical protein [Robertmurraya andreesenii]MDQ0154912.1 hypothetical protein [Robertmurraya andreesenii]
MASITNEIESIAEVVEPLFPGANVYYQRIPAEPKMNELSIRFIAGGSSSETNYHYRLDHDFQIVYFGRNEFDCLTKFEALERKLNDGFLIPIKGSLRYMRIGSFSFSQPFKTEGGANAILGVLNVEVREARTQQQYEKIAVVNPRIN